jgi:hypothetical protein
MFHVESARIMYTKISFDQGLEPTYDVVLHFQFHVQSRPGKSIGVLYARISMAFDSVIVREDLMWIFVEGLDLHCALYRYAPPPECKVHR